MVWALFVGAQTTIMDCYPSGKQQFIESTDDVIIRQFSIDLLTVPFYQCLLKMTECVCIAAMILTWMLLNMKL